MESILNYNGNLISSSTNCISVENQVSQIGVFETMRYSIGKIKNYSDHFARLWKGIELLHLNIPNYYTIEFFEAEVEKLIKSCNVNEARIRLSILETHGKETNFIIEAFLLNPSSNKLIISEFNISVYEKASIIAGKFSAIKTNNRLLYIMAQKFAAENKLNDVLLLNQFGRICDSTIANIFFIKNKKIYTPPISEGCIEGTMRKNIIKVLLNLGYDVNEMVIETKTLNDADEIFITNSIINMKHVSTFNGRELDNEFSQTIFNKIMNSSDLFL